MNPRFLIPQASRLPMLDIYSPLMHSATLVAAIRLNLFHTLADGVLSLSQLVEKTGCSMNGLVRLLTYLESVGYVTKITSELGSTLYGNTEHTTRWFTPYGEVDYSAGVLWSHEAWKMMNDLDDVIRIGKPKEVLWDRMLKDKTLGPLFSRYMRAFAQHLRPDVSRILPIKEHQTRLLDVGGSHGLHTIELCNKYPQLQATILDYPSALLETPTFLKDARVDHRVKLSPGNLLDMNFDNAFDVVLYFGVAHNQTSENNYLAISKMIQALRSGGYLLIHDYPVAQPVQIPYYAAFDLTLLYETGTSTHTDADFVKWLSKDGDVSRIDLDPIEKGTFYLYQKY